MPWRDAKFTSRFKGRLDLLAYAKQKGFPVPATPAAPYSVDSNMLHISYESGVLEDPAKPAPKGIYQMTCDAEDAPDVAEDMEITFEKGINLGCISINCIRFSYKMSVTKTIK